MESLLQLNNKVKHAANIFFAIKKKKNKQIKQNLWRDQKHRCPLDWFLEYMWIKKKKLQIDLRLNIYIDQVEYYRAPGKQVLQIH